MLAASPPADPVQLTRDKNRLCYKNPQFQVDLTAVESSDRVSAGRMLQRGVRSKSETGEGVVRNQAVVLGPTQRRGMDLTLPSLRRQSARCAIP